MSSNKHEAHRPEDSSRPEFNKPAQHEYLFGPEWYESNVLFDSPHYKVTAVREKQHFEDVLFYIVELADVVILIDTGSGFAPIHDLLPKGKKVIIMQTHSDWDHTGSTGEVARLHNATTYIGKYDPEKFEQKRMESGWPNAEIGGLNPEQFTGALQPDPEALKRFKIEPFLNSLPYDFSQGSTQRFEYGADGDKVRVEVIPTPGHTPGGVCILVEGSLEGVPFGHMYTGDLIYPAFQDIQAKGSNPEELLNSAKLLWNMYGNRITQIMPAHNTTWSPPALVERYIAALEGELKPDQIETGVNELGEYIDEIYAGTEQTRFTLRLPKSFRQ